MTSKSFSRKGGRPGSNKLNADMLGGVPLRVEEVLRIHRALDGDQQDLGDL